MLGSKDLKGNKTYPPEASSLRGVGGETLNKQSHKFSFFKCDKCK